MVKDKEELMSFKTELLLTQPNGKLSFHVFVLSDVSILHKFVFLQ